MPTALEAEFHAAMEEIYRRAKDEVAYNATKFRGMVAEHGGPKTARILINANTVSDGYTALWERKRLDLTVEAKVVETPRFHALFTEAELEICRQRLKKYGYAVDSEAEANTPKASAKPAGGVDIANRITTDPRQCGGRPCIRGMRIRVTDVLDLLGAGLSQEAILDEMPDLEVDDITACIQFASRRIDHPVLAG